MASQKRRLRGIGATTEHFSMGMTPPEGLIMGTRYGDLDPSCMFLSAIFMQLRVKTCCNMDLTMVRQDVQKRCVGQIPIRNIVKILQKKQTKTDSFELAFRREYLQ